MINIIFMHEKLIKVVANFAIKHNIYFMKRLDLLKRKLKPGQVYRRADLEKWSTSVDRDLAKLVAEGILHKISRGLYEYPKKSRFGILPPDTKKLVKVFLKDDDFLMLSPNIYNTLGVGTTQLYNISVVYNHKRHGRFELKGQIFDFRMKPYFPKKTTPEFLLVDLVNNLNHLAENTSEVLTSVSKKISHMNHKKLRAAVKKFAKVSTRKFFEELLNNDSKTVSA